MLRAIVIDDEKYAVEMLCDLLEEDGRVEIIEGFISVQEAMRFIENHDVDIVFSDIEMPELDGISFGKWLQKHHKHVVLIFTTAYSRYALEAYDNYAFGYLLKPVQLSKLNLLLEKIIGIQSGKSSSKLLVQTLKGSHFEKNGKNMKFRTKKTKELLSYLLHKNGDWVTNEDILDKLWCDRSESARKQLHTTLYYLRKSFEQVDAKGIFETDSGTHRLNMVHIEWDYLMYIEQLKKYTDSFMTRQMYIQLLEKGESRYFSYEWASDTFYYLNALSERIREYQKNNSVLSVEETKRLLFFI